MNLNCPNLPKEYSLFYKKSPSHDFILRTLTFTFMLSFNIHLTSSSKQERKTLPRQELKITEYTYVLSLLLLQPFSPEKLLLMLLGFHEILFQLLSSNTFFRNLVKKHALTFCSCRYFGESFMINYGCTD